MATSAVSCLLALAGKGASSLTITPISTMPSIWLNQHLASQTLGLPPFVCACLCILRWNDRECPYSLLTDAFINLTRHTLDHFILPSVLGALPPAQDPDTDVVDASHGVSPLHPRRTRTQLSTEPFLPASHCRRHGLRGACLGCYHFPLPAMFPKPARTASLRHSSRSRS